MQVTETLSEGLNRAYRIVVPAAEVETRVNAKLDEIGATTRINGFRSGKAPRPLLLQRFGKQARADAVHDVLRSTWQQAMLDRGVRAALPPLIDIVASEAGADLEYTLKLEMLPEFEPADVKGMKLTRYAAEVSAEWVEEALRELARAEGGDEPAEDGYAAQEGDSTRISFDGTIDGKAHPGASTGPMSLRLGPGAAIPGLTEGLVGARKGETREIALALPKEWPVKEAAGRTALCRVSVQEVLRPREVAVDDAFAARFGMADLDALRAALRERRQREHRAAARLKLKRQVLDKLADMHDIPTPSGLVNREFDTIWRQIEQDMERAGETWETVDENEDAARKDYREIAERRIRLGIVLTELGRRNDITVPRDEINRALVARARMHPGKEREMFDMFRANPELVHEIRAPLFEEKVIDYIVEIADVTERAVGEAELLGEGPPTEGESDARPG